MMKKGFGPLWLLYTLALLVMESKALNNFEAFKRMSVNYPETQAPNVNIYCQNIMKSRGHLHLRSNVYIHEPDDVLKAMCLDPFGRPITRERTSSFPVKNTLCGGEFSRIWGIRGKDRAVVYCRNGYPIEFRGLSP